jgi:hypothetical protein
MLWEKKYPSGAKNGLIFDVLIMTVLALTLAGCTVANSGRLQGSPEATEVFKSNRILPDHQYFVSGFQRVPYAIIAVDNKYQLRSRRWQAIDLDATALNQLIYRMENVYSLNPRGALILDHEGNQLGLWYSSQYQTTVRREKDNRIVVVSPEPPDLRGIR